MWCLLAEVHEEAWQPAFGHGSLGASIKLVGSALLTATVHPSSGLRDRVDREKAHQLLVADLRAVRSNVARRA